MILNLMVVRLLPLLWDRIHPVMILNLCYIIKIFVVDLNCTVGRFCKHWIVDIMEWNEPIVLSGSKAVGVSTPGVVQVYSMEVVGSIFFFFKLRNNHLVLSWIGSFVV